MLKSTPLVCLILLLASCHHYPDSPLEEWVEELILLNTGVEVEFTPGRTALEVPVHKF